MRVGIKQRQEENAPGLKSVVPSFVISSSSASASASATSASQFDDLSVPLFSTSTSTSIPSSTIIPKVLKTSYDFFDITTPSSNLLFISYRRPNELISWVNKELFEALMGKQQSKYVLTLPTLVTWTNLSINLSIYLSVYSSIYLFIYHLTYARRYLHPHAHSKFSLAISALSSTSIYLALKSNILFNLILFLLHLLSFIRSPLTHFYPISTYSLLSDCILSYFIPFASSNLTIYHTTLHNTTPHNARYKAISVLLHYRVLSSF